MSLEAHPTSPVRQLCRSTSAPTMLLLFFRAQAPGEPTARMNPRLRGLFFILSMLGLSFLAYLSQRISVHAPAYTSTWPYSSLSACVHSCSSMIFLATEGATPGQEYFSTLRLSSSKSSDFAHSTSHCL
jgi:hypothetical protein